MFSGLIAYRGVLEAVLRDPRGGLRLTVASPEAIADGVAVKDSVAVNGTCLTVVAFDTRVMHFDVVPETVSRTTFVALAPGDPVNLELSLRLGDRLGGHLVYGHVDAVTTLREKRPEGQGHRLFVLTPPDLRRFIVEKGYVAIDGVSLTVARVSGDSFEIALIPETSARTTLGVKGDGAGVNIEIDPIARYALGAADAYATNTTNAAEIAWAYEI